MEDGETSYNYFFSLMARSDGEAKYEVTPFNIKKNLNDYSPKKLKKITNVLIDCVCELTAEKDLLRDKVKSLEHEKLALTIQLSKIGEHSLKLLFENKKILEN